jgi:hypothetical protein
MSLGDDTRGSLKGFRQCTSWLYDDKKKKKYSKYICYSFDLSKETVLAEKKFEYENKVKLAREFKISEDFIVYHRKRFLEKMEKDGPDLLEKFFTWDDNIFDNYPKWKNVFINQPNKKKLAFFNALTDYVNIIIERKELFEKFDGLSKLTSYHIRDFKAHPLQLNTKSMVELNQIYCSFVSYYQQLVCLLLFLY